MDLGLDFKSPGSCFSASRTYDLPVKSVGFPWGDRTGGSDLEAPKISGWRSRHTNMISWTVRTTHLSRWHNHMVTQVETSRITRNLNPAHSAESWANQCILSNYIWGVPFYMSSDNVNTVSAELWKALAPGPLNFNHKNFWVALSISCTFEVSTLSLWVSKQVLESHG